jgi:hypothetical protein
MCKKHLTRYFLIENNTFKYKLTANAPKFKKEIPLEGTSIRLETLSPTTPGWE